MVTNVALDRVFAHTNEKCEKKATLQMAGGIREIRVEQVWTN